MVLGLSPPLGELLKNFSEKNSEMIIAENYFAAHEDNNDNNNNNENDNNYNNNNYDNNNNNNNNNNRDNDKGKNINKNKKYFEDNHTTTSINLFSGNFADVKDANPAESVISSFASKSVDLTAASNQDKSEITSSASIRKSHRTISRASRPILKSAVRSSADRELDNMTGKPNLISRKKSEDILRYIIK